MQPLANALRESGDTSEEFRAPLAVALCENCGLSQLTVVVDPEILYKGYRFRSGTSEAWRKHCADLAEQCGEPGRVLDIACNDGACLKEFLDRGWDCAGVDPAPAHNTGAIFFRKAFWSFETANVLYANSRFDLVIAQNVLGHVDDPIDFLKGIKAVLAEDGQAVIEVPNVGNLIDDCAFDTIYHEHLSYWSAKSLTQAAESAGLGVQRVEKLDVHGGSVRYWLSHREGQVWWVMTEPYFWAYGEFGQRVADRMIEIAKLICDKDFIAWGASAKGAVMLNAMRSCWPYQPRYVIDETAEKVGLQMPGVRLPIVAPPEDLSDVDVIWILSWNNAAVISSKARLKGFKGKFLLTHPTVGLVD